MNFPPLIGHTCLTAGAGAGKTRRLVETYVGLLAEGLNPQEIVAITFTEKAAAEMRSRVVGYLADLAAAKAPGPDWRRLLPQVEWAPISTIHSFCVSLLREFGAALGLDPDFRVMEAEEHHDIVMQILDDILRREMQNASSRLARLIAHYPLAPQGGLGARLAEALDALATSGVSPLEAAKRSAKAHRDAVEEAPEIIKALGSLINGLAIERSSGSLASSKAKFIQKVDQLIIHWPEFKATLLENLQHQNIHDKLYTLTGTNWGKNFNPTRQSLRALTDQLRDLASLPESAELTQDFLSLLADLDQELSQDLKRRSAVSFDALLSGARDLVRQSPQVLQTLRTRYKALLVDEYQDVNPVQGELVGLLSGMLEPVQNAQPPRLLVVGDRKQSIYAFRGAEVSLYARTMEKFELGAGRVEALPNNWRSAHRLVKFFNRLFPKVFSPGSNAQYDPSFYVEYRPDDKQAPSRTQPEPDLPCVEVLQVDSPEEITRAEDWRRREAEALGLYLRRLIDGHGVNPGDIALLFRRLTQVDLYEQGLSQAGVDYYTLRGRGFFACQEIKDVYYAVKAALHEYDDLALAAWLRSPMVGLSDEALLALVHGRGQAVRLNAGLMEGGGGLEWLEPAELQRISFARRCLSELRCSARRVKPAELVQGIIEECDYLAVMLGTPGGEQKAANLRKLIEMCRELGNGGAGSIEEFVSHLDEKLKSPPSESKAPLLGEEAQVVRLMTVHQSKGLEFPVVVLPDLAGSDARPGQSALPSPGGVFSLPPRDFINDKPKSNPICTQLRNLDKASQEAETARLFYVACTRATESLVFCLNGATHQTTWGKWVQDFVLQDPETSLKGSDELEALPMGLDASPQEGQITEEVKQQAGTIIERCLHPQAPRAHLLRESVSGLEDWFDCPRRYYFTRVLGLDTAMLPGGGPASDPMGPGQAASLGSQVHRILEEAPLWQGPQSLSMVEFSPEQPDLVRSLAGGVFETEVGRLISQTPPDNIFREQGFTVRIKGRGGPDLDITGEIDMLLVSPEGLKIIDYKVSGHVAPEEYALQLRMYALAAWRAAGCQQDSPQAGICYLKPSGAELHWLDLNMHDLQSLERDLIKAAADIAALPLEPCLSDFSRGAGCSRACALARSGLCATKED